MDFPAADIRAELPRFKEHTSAQRRVGGRESQDLVVYKLLRACVLLIPPRCEIWVPNQFTGCSVLRFDDRSPRGFDLICYLAYTSQCRMAGLPKSYRDTLVIVRTFSCVTSARMG